MNRENLEAVVNSIFNEVKLKVIANIKNDLDDILEEYDEYDEEFLLVEDNYKRIIDYYDDEYLMKLILKCLEDKALLEIDDESSLISEVAELVSENIADIGYPKFIHSQDFFDWVDGNFGWNSYFRPNNIDDYFYVQLAYMDIYYHWKLEKGYLLECECKACNEQYEEYGYFNDYRISYGIHELLHNHVEIIRENVTSLLSKQYSHLQQLFKNNH